MKRFLYPILIVILITTTLIRCEKDKGSNDKIPYLPIPINNVSYIYLAGYSQEGKHSNNREATQQEVTQIIDWLNSIEQYDSEIKIPKNKMGKPIPSNIRIFTKDTAYTKALYILEKDDDYVILCLPETNKGYVVKQKELNKLLKALRK